MNKSEAYNKAMGIIAKESPANTDELRYLVLYLSDINSIGYSEIIEYLKKIGEPIIPLIKNNLYISSEGEFHSSLLHSIVKDWPKERVEKIQEELDQLAWYGNPDWGVDIDAMKILIKNGMAKKDYLKRLINNKIQSCIRRQKELEIIKEQIDGS